MKYTASSIKWLQRRDVEAAIVTSVKIFYIYKMSGRLVNVRLDEKQLRRVRKLRGAGIPLSELVREAIDRRYEQVVESSRPFDVDVIMKRIYEECPDPADLPARDYDVHDRAEARRAILRKLRTRR